MRLFQNDKMIHDVKDSLVKLIGEDSYSEWAKKHIPSSHNLDIWLANYFPHLNNLQKQKLKMLELTEIIKEILMLKMTAENNKALILAEKVKDAALAEDLFELDSRYKTYIEVLNSNDSMLAHSLMSSSKNVRLPAIKFALASHLAYLKSLLLQAKSTITNIQKLIRYHNGEGVKQFAKITHIAQRIIIDLPSAVDHEHRELHHGLPKFIAHLHHFTAQKSAGHEAQISAAQELISCLRDLMHFSDLKKTTLKHFVKLKHHCKVHAAHSSDAKSLELMEQNVSELTQSVSEKITEVTLFKVDITKGKLDLPFKHLFQKIEDIPDKLCQLSDSVHTYQEKIIPEQNASRQTNKAMPAKLVSARSKKNHRLEGARGSGISKPHR
jgi:hypothetical protein